MVSSSFFPLPLCNKNFNAIEHLLFVKNHLGRVEKKVGKHTIKQCYLSSDVHDQLRTSSDLKVWRVISACDKFHFYFVRNTTTICRLWATMPIQAHSGWKTTWHIDYLTLIKQRFLSKQKQPDGVKRRGRQASLVCKDGICFLKATMLTTVVPGWIWPTALSGLDKDPDYPKTVASSLPSRRRKISTKRT